MIQDIMAMLLIPGVLIYLIIYYNANNSGFFFIFLYFDSFQTTYMMAHCHVTVTK